MEVEALTQEPFREAIWHSIATITLQQLQNILTHHYQLIQFFNSIQLCTLQYISISCHLVSRYFVGLLATSISYLCHQSFTSEHSSFEIVSLFPSS